MEGCNTLTIIALAPAVFLLTKIYKADKLEPEPKPFLVRLVFKGILSTVFAVFTERIGQSLLLSFFEEGTYLYNFLFYFFVVALSEEGFKFLLLKKVTWYNPNFDCQFDAIVYAECVSLGFALWENLQYVYGYGLATALVRAVTAVPGHASFGIFMGIFYGYAKRLENYGMMKESKRNLRLSVIIPVLFHGFYDFCATSNGFLGSVVFVVFIILMFNYAKNAVKTFSENDSFFNKVI